MNTKIILAIILLSVSFSFTRNSKSNPEITAKELKKHISFLASDEMKGRKPGTPEDLVVANYIRKQFADYGLKMMGDNGFHHVELVAGVELGENNAVQIGNKKLSMHTDFRPLSFSEDATLNAKIAVVGFGLDIKTDKTTWNDYQGIDVKGKWALIMIGEPKFEGRQNPYEEFSGLRTKVLTAKDHGALGVLFVTAHSKSKTDELTDLFYDKVESTAGIPVIHISRNIADMILESMNYNLLALENEMNKIQAPISSNIDVELSGQTDIDLIRVNSQNILAMVEGSDPLLKNEYIIVGAHYDHLGMGGHGSGSRFPDTVAVHNGADDNASGVAGIIELAGSLQKAKKDLKRSIVFIAFTGEEMGLLGSKNFVESQLLENSSMKTMINFDMIGRLNKKTMTLLVGGSGTAIESDSLLHMHASKHGFNLKLSPEGYGPSDHAAFYSKSIPVIFISTGAHADYHTWQDDIDKIDFEGEQQVLMFSESLIKDLASASNPLTFKEAGPKERASSTSYKVTLGIMPDFAAGDIKGLKVEVARKGAPANKGGMEDGDIITAINGLSVNNIYDYMNRLKKLNVGESITVDVLRGEETHVLIIQL
ncbi:MAG: M20/M25/M40 family metallo-hydrolase [Cytophagia bacterium]|nr:M20/M25/M40 family metallo-hydrolase [Cytophagia bacterium]